MELRLIDAQPAAIRAGYECPCGCTPSVAYARDAAVAEEGCCCGNEFAVGPQASAALTARAGFRAEHLFFDAPWGERLEAAWLVGPSVHGPSGDHGDDDAGREHETSGHEHHDSNHGDGPETPATDPVCGMTVDPESARAKGLSIEFNGSGYFFCGRGCKLEFEDDPDRYLDPTYVPSM